MFTGLIQGQGRVIDFQRTATHAQLTLATPAVSKWQSKVGDSIAVSGVCLTVTALTPTSATVELMPETLRRTTLGGLVIGELVNLEPALRVGDRLAGHIVQGHVDTVGRITHRSEDENAVVLTIAYPAAYRPQVVSKGAIAIDGVSLTLTTVTSATFSVSLIPHTLAATTLTARRSGDMVNLETDVLGKYLAHQREVLA